MFITGACNIWPGDMIRVQYVDLKKHLRPMSQTCFKILQLPRQYLSFTDVSRNILKFIQDEESCLINEY